VLLCHGGHAAERGRVRTRLTEIGAAGARLTTGYADTGAAVIANSDYVHFTGSTATGRKVAVACAERLIPYSLELGGKNPALVLADADLERAANGITFGGMFNSGQACISVERVYVEAPIYDEFVAKLTDKVSQLRQGQDDRGYRFDVGAIATAAQRDIATPRRRSRRRGCARHYRR
jgi:acyl-CoA reductase-like NAD-dependent aldehyde dehydrogenase